MQGGPLWSGSHQDRPVPAVERTCSSCGAVGAPKPLHVRSWACQHCGVLHDRDVNAAKVILAAGLAERENACGAEEDLVAPLRGQASV
ncbi:zinc ribbon domain-containing protein [Glycomyces rhizosphaerae]|uniref:Zinc ribbon domain-containing protein n=1 Tax=Glycomyces rhizosphaerae TaxID=2054422 RepID=A0ABV7PY10_9ACTN